MEIIPAIDLIDGKCVRLTQGDFNQKKIYHEDPVVIARQFEDAGMRRLHLVDLDGAKAGKVQNLRVLENITSATGLQIDFGGGIKTKESVDAVLSAGAAFVTVGSIAVKEKETLVSWFEIYSADKFILGADVIGKKIAIHGWTETVEKDVFSFIEEYFKLGIRQVFCTDVSKDGKLEGPSVALYKEIIERFPELFFIASGGVSNIQDLEDLNAIGCKAAIVGKAIYEQRITLQELINFQTGSTFNVER